MVKFINQTAIFKAFDELPSFCKRQNVTCDRAQMHDQRQ